MRSSTCCCYYAVVVALKHTHISIVDNDFVWIIIVVVVLSILLLYFYLHKDHSPNIAKSHRKKVGKRTATAAKKKITLHSRKTNAHIHIQTER